MFYTNLLLMFFLSYRVILC